MIVMGPFQYNILYDSMNLLYRVTGKLFMITQRKHYGPMPEEELHIMYSSWSCPRAVRSATYMCGQYCQGSSVCSAGSGNTWWWWSSAGLLEEIKPSNYVFLRGFTRLFLTLFFVLLIWKRQFCSSLSACHGSVFVKAGISLSQSVNSKL